MNKPEQLIEYTIRDVVEYYVLDENTSMKEAMEKFYASEIFMKLQDAETGLYLYGSAYVYGLFCDELQNGAIIQAEI